METALVSALIAALVSLIGLGVTLYASRQQARAASEELALKRQELEHVGRRFRADAESLRQNLMRDVLVRRTDAYAALWKVFITYERNWMLEERPLNLAWAEAFVRELNECNATHGVFFSEPVYQAFFEYRTRLIALLAQLRAGTPVTRADLDRSLVEVSTLGFSGGKPSLAAAMKDDLGSYMKMAIRVA